MEPKNQRVVVVGLGKSGVAAALMCQRRGATVTGFDSTAVEKLSEAARALPNQGISISGGGGLAGALEGAEWIVVSPGVPWLPELAHAQTQGALVIGELELSVRLMATPAPVLCIGGTNGKSTTTSLVGALLQAHLPAVFVGGNLGTPLADHVDVRFDAVVLEVSSFQVERLTSLKPSVAALLNVTPDHLDRYPNFEAYAHAKGNVFVRQDPSDLAVVPARDELCLAQARRGSGTLVTFGPGGDVEVTDEAILDHVAGARYARGNISLQGSHNALNIAAALAVVRPYTIPHALIEATLAGFQGLPHRTALVAEIDGVRYYDDSKGTNVGAAVTALMGLREPKAVLLAGGRDKGGSYASLVDALRTKGRAAVVIGEAADALIAAVGNVIPVHRARSMQEAVRVGAGLAKRGDAVLLSPGCSSFDMFRDYHDRGEQFAREVRALAGGQTR